GSCEKPVASRHHLDANDSSLRLGHALRADRRLQSCLHLHYGDDMVITREDDESLLYRVTDNSALEGGQHDWSGWEKWIRGHIMNERQVMARAMGEVVAETCKEMREERARELAERDTKIARLEGKVEVLLTLLGQKELKEVGKVIDLPAWRARDAR